MSSPRKPFPRRPQTAPRRSKRSFKRSNPLIDDPTSPFALDFDSLIHAVFAVISALVAGIVQIIRLVAPGARQIVAILTLGLGSALLSATKHSAKRPRAVRIGALIVLTPLALIGGGWTVVRLFVEKSVENGIAAITQDGEVSVSYRELAFEGFPFVIRVRVDSPVVKRSGGIAWTSSTLVVQAPLWSLTEAKFEIPQSQKITFPSVDRSPLPSPPLEFSIADARGDVQWLWSGQITEVRAALKKLTLGLAEAEQIAEARNTGTLSAETVFITAKRPTTTPTDHTQPGLKIAFTANAVSAPPAMLPPPALSALGGRIEAFGLQAQVMGEIPQINSNSLARWRQDGGALEIGAFVLTWGPLAIHAQGTLALDIDLQPEGAFSSHIAGFIPVIETLAAIGQMKPKDARNAKAILTLAAHKPQDGVGQPTISIPATLQKRRFSLGPAIVGVAPFISWQ
ncbi:hypothetical protein CCP2SC5_10036 [Azospirillaceae bacterium]